MPDGTRGAVGLVVYMMDPDAGFFDVRPRIRPFPAFQERRKGKHQLRNEYQQQRWFPLSASGGMIAFHVRHVAQSLV